MAFPVGLTERCSPINPSNRRLAGSDTVLTAYNSNAVASDRTFDPVDLQILEILQTNARETQADIARAVGLAPSAVLERIRKLEARGVLRGYTAQIDPSVLGLGMLAFVAVRTEGDFDAEDRIARTLAENPEILEVHDVAGDDCLLVKVRARDAAHLGQLIRNRIGRIPGVRSTRTTIVLETIKETPRLPVPKVAQEEVS
jgi:Lrp/AsnC family transcriptional regulator, leucine-responsive regulatory protein